MKQTAVVALRMPDYIILFYFPGISPGAGLREGMEDHEILFPGPFMYSSGYQGGVLALPSSDYIS